MGLPEIITEQASLLTVDTNTAPVVVDTLPGVDVWPLFLDAEKGVWVLRAKFKPGLTLPKHFHTGEVHFYTTAGKWYYLEHQDRPQTAGSYLYEPGGSIHTFHCPADSEGAEGFMVVFGANVNFDDDGNLINIMDAGWIEQTILAVAKAQGIKPQYIKAGSSAQYTG